MAYINGTAATLEALRTAIFSACTAEGWSLSGDVLSKSGMFARVQVVSGTLRLLGGTGIDGSNNLTGAATNFVSIGGLSIDYPLAYEIFVFDAEIYVVVNYGVDRYQFCAWGKTTVAGVGGTGMWFGATMGSTLSSALAISFSGNTAQPSGALFWFAWPNNTTRVMYLHHGLDGGGWAEGNALAGAFNTINDLLSLLPNSWNSEAVLIPARIYLSRPSNKYSLVADAEHFRHVRIDNYEPGQVITLGPDRWKILPWHRKDSANRNGGNSIQHTGTFGWAIRYEGP